MPFCRECGKQVEDDWVSCPFCSQPIGPPSSAMSGVQDSVVMGDISINETTTCNNCGSLGAVKLPCFDCKELCSCELCSERYFANITSKYQNKYEGSVASISTFGDYPTSSVYQLRCERCWIEFIELKCNKTCITCRKRFQLPDSGYRWWNFREIMGEDTYDGSDPEWVETGEECKKCSEISQEITKWTPKEGELVTEYGSKKLEYNLEMYEKRKSLAVENTNPSDDSLHHQPTCDDSD